MTHPWDVLSFDWPLTPDSVVLEVGGFKGRWAAEIAARYGPRLYVFEPQPWAAEICRQALAPYPSAQVLGYGLGAESGHFPMGEWETDGCSFVAATRRVGAGQLVEFGAAMGQLGIESIDLMLLNVEGYEYRLLPHLAATGWLARMQRLMVQFHAFCDPGGAQYGAARALVEQTHRVLWDYGVALIAWERSGAKGA